LYSNLRFVICASLIGCAGLIGVLALLPPTLEERLLASAELSAAPAPACNQQNWLHFDRNCLSRRGMPWVADLPAQKEAPSPVESAPRAATSGRESILRPNSVVRPAGGGVGESTRRHPIAADTSGRHRLPAGAGQRVSAGATPLAHCRGTSGSNATQRSAAAGSLSAAGRRRTACGQAAQRHAASARSTGRHRTARRKARRRDAATRPEESSSRSSWRETEQ
jgi:hypothetical protein